MQAPNLQAIYNYEAAIEDAWQGILTAAGLPNLVAEFSSQALVTPRVEIMVDASAPTGHVGIISSSAQALDAWNGSLTTRTVTNRSRHGNELHRQMLAIARIEALYFKQRFDEKRLPFHVMTQITESGKRSYVDRETDTDNTELTHKILFSVRAGAWPAVLV